MSSVSATVKNGEIVTSASQNSLSEKKTESTGMDKDAFLQLLVAQMKYQDPLQPTSNTEYIAQYAQFSQVEALNNMSTTMELSRYSSYVGKEVVIETSDSSGNSNQIRGYVDYVTFEEGKAYFSIEGDLYAAEDMVTVISNQYSNAESIAQTIADTLKSLPAIDSISIGANGNTISNLNSLYNSLSDYEKGFVDDDDAKMISAYASKLNELIAQANYEAEQKAKKEAVSSDTSSNLPENEISDEAINAIVTDNENTGSSENEGDEEESTGNVSDDGI